MRRDGVYYRADRGTYWISWLDASGKRHRRQTSAKNLAEARQFRAGEMLKVEQIKALGFKPAGDETFEYLAAEYLSKQKTTITPKGHQRESEIFRLHLIPFFSGRLSDVNRARIEKYLISRHKAEAGAATIRKELQILKHAMRYAVALDYLPLNPAQDVRGPKEPAGRVRYLQPDELRLLLETCPAWLRPIAGLAVSTGMRQGEVLGLRWADVDRRNRVIVLPKTKNGLPRHVPLNEMALTVIGTLPGAATKQKPSALLFPSVGTYNRVSVTFSRACRSASLEDFRFHDLRHTAASWLRMGGADLQTVAVLLGHKSLRMASRYSHLSPAFLAAEVGRLDIAFANVISPALPDKH